MLLNNDSEFFDWKKEAEIIDIKICCDTTYHYYKKNNKIYEVLNWSGKYIVAEKEN